MRNTTRNFAGCVLLAFLPVIINRNDLLPAVGKVTLPISISGNVAVDENPSTGEP